MSETINNIFSNVGIGTVSPAANLHVYSNTAHAIIQASSTAGLGKYGGLKLEGEGTSSTIIGHGGGINYSVDGSNDHTFVVGGVDKVKIDNSGLREISDDSFKKDIQKIPDALKKINQLEGVSFKWKDTSKTSIGLIAQDIEKVFPELVSTDKETGLKSLQYTRLIAPLIKAIKEQQHQIEELEEEVRELSNK